MSIQSEFKKFNDRIRLDFKTNSELAEKRDVLLGILEKDGDLPPFKKLDQGSYAMYTGIKPGDDREYDIDVGLTFNVSKSEYNPMDLKKDIEKLLKNQIFPSQLIFLIQRKYIERYNLIYVKP